MTKRFKNVIEGNFVLFYDGDEQIPFDEVVGVLNSLNDENEQLKSENIQLTVDNKELKCTNNELYQENEQLKQSNERIVKDIDLALGFIRHKGYSLQDIKDYEDAKKEYEEELANYRKGDVE